MIKYSMHAESRAIRRGDTLENARGNKTDKE
jgi:hypothetical protein